jgi:hypothetical protein
MWYFLIYFPLAVWMFIDSKRRRYDKGLWWALGTAFIGPLTAPAYFAYRPLRKGESREGGRAWVILKNFALFWTVTMAGCTLAGMANVADTTNRMTNEYERAGAAIGSALGLGLLFIVWLLPMIGAVMVGVFLKKANAVENGPTGALATEEEAQYTLGDLASHVKAASQVAASKVKVLAEDIKERANQDSSKPASKSKGPADLLAQAKEQIAAGQREKALALLQDVIAFFPDSPEATTAAVTLKKAGVSPE